jgi:SAM-dependent methyltransferase
VKGEFAGLLRCPACGRDGTLALSVQARDEREIRDGLLRCAVCATEFPVHRGVPELLHEPPAHILAEAAGLERFAGDMTGAGWGRETVLALPDIEHGYWYVQARSMHQLLSTIPFQAGQSVLDVGSNTCWAANHFAERGLHAIALDIATVELQGLYTADYFLEQDEVFFERVLGSMAAIPLASNSVDYVYCCEVLHHNDADSLRRTFAEIFRVLRPGGRLLMINETLKTLRDRSGVHLDGVEQYEGYEHAHWAMRYRWEAMRAGFMTDVTEPHYRPFFGDSELAGASIGSGRAAPARRLGFALRRFGLARRVYLMWLNHIWGGVSMNMVATKPARYLPRSRRTSAVERVVRMLAAGLRLRRERRRGEAPPRLPRTPEQAQEEYLRVISAA